MSFQFVPQSFEKKNQPCLSLLLWSYSLDCCDLWSAVSFDKYMRNLVFLIFIEDIVKGRNSQFFEIFEQQKSNYRYSEQKSQEYSFGEVPSEQHNIIDAAFSLKLEDNLTKFSAISDEGVFDFIMSVFFFLFEQFFLHLLV